MDNNANNGNGGNNGVNGNYQPVKSATVAGLLGIFLGWCGAHDWYLGRKTQGIIHVCLFGGAFVVLILAGILTAVAISSFSTVLAGIAELLVGLASLVQAGNGIWGFVEGIVLLVQGDAGLARKGYNVAAPMAYNQNQPMMNNGMNNNTNSGNQMNNNQSTNAGQNQNNDNNNSQDNSSNN